MNLNPSSTWLRQRTTSTAGLLPLLLLTLAHSVQAQFNYTTNNGTITITRYIGPGGAVVIPDTISGLPVTSIVYPAFSDLTNVTSVTIGNSVTNIGSRAFYRCDNLTAVTIPDSVTSIGESAFIFCFSLTGVTIPNSVTSIGESAFLYCFSLTGVTIPNGVTSIENSTFFYCLGLTSITIGNSVTSIGEGALANTSLTSVTIPDSVRSIGPTAFAYGSKLTGVYFQGNAPMASSSAFTSADNATVYYLPGTTGWGTTFAGRPTVLWNPLISTADAGFGVRTNRFGFNITGTSNLVLVVEASTNLVNPAWSPVGTNTLTGGSSYFSDPEWTNHPARFYRLRAP